ncbi:unnamed protein product [Kuraishia capsulata CBS 1993]|uniref:Serine/threonine-protein kinase n=1 Tax=Kuraishia capsulata CBS 1993 TaxID=1382522 RepID=W6MI50_9ASCO|nr:uncharacterized protein KUCA_T00002050001 [Kuraishia capsulata CBS 1993]CDK26079.1 unnamed protein product [Kuraishia capsulata CBS 1993]
MASSNNQALQALNQADLNARTNAFQTPLKIVRPTTQRYEGKEVEKKKKREKLSALCKTPPSVVRTRTGRGYHRGLFLGEGGFARCFQMKDETGKIFAAKTVAKASIKTEKTKTKLLSEIKIHKSMNHPNIVQFIDCFEDDINVYILLEICPNQSLMDLLKARKSITEPEARFFSVQIAGAVKYLHSRRIIHRDLKLGNIFFDPDMNLKIGDFGLASSMGADTKKRYTICGTPNYIAPEVLGGKEVGHSFEVDIWAIGIMIFALLFGKPPFQNKDVQVIYERIKANDLKFPSSHQISYSAVRLIKKLLSPSPMERPSIAEILESPWFREGLFPSRITMESLRKTPKSLEFLTTEESRINFINAKQSVGFDDNKRTPVEILRTDLESEKPKTLLPQSLSPGNTKSKYQEISPKAIKPLRNRLAQELNGTFENKLNEMMNEDIYTVLHNMQKVEASFETTTTLREPVMVNKWVDYSNRYGFSYQLSTNAMGLLFTDTGHTVVKFLPTDDIMYIEADERKGWTMQQYSSGMIPPELDQHMEVFEFFSNYMILHLSDVSEFRRFTRSRDIFLRRFTREDHYIMFELSNGTFQFNFTDHHKIVISQGGLCLFHITPEKVVELCSLGEVLANGDFLETGDSYFDIKYEMIKSALKQKIIP